MRKVVILVAVLTSSGLWADWFCGSLEMKGDQINIKKEYVEIIKNYCTKTTVDFTGRCHLIEFDASGTASIKDQHVDGVKTLCTGVSCESEPTSSSCVRQEEERSWFVDLLITLGGSQPHWRR